MSDNKMNFERTLRVRLNSPTSQQLLTAISIIQQELGANAVVRVLQSTSGWDQDVIIEGMQKVRLGLDTERSPQ